MLNLDTHILRFAFSGDLTTREGFPAPVQVWPLSYQICAQMRKLDFTSDPTDELICATSMVHEVPLVTRDRMIRKSAVVPLA